MCRAGHAARETREADTGSALTHVRDIRPKFPQDYGDPGLHAIPGDVQLGRLRPARFRPHAVLPLPDRVRPADHRHRVAPDVRPPSFRDGADVASSTQSAKNRSDRARCKNV